MARLHARSIRSLLSWQKLLRPSIAIGEIEVESGDGDGKATQRHAIASLSVAEAIQHQLLVVPQTQLVSTGGASTSLFYTHTNHYA